jgi:hypothetical protein
MYVAYCDISLQMQALFRVSKGIGPRPPIATMNPVKVE